MKRCTSFVAALLIIAASVSTARAVIVFQDDFNSYADQAAFEASWAKIGCQGNGVVTSCSAGLTNPESNTLSQDFPLQGNSLLNNSPANGTTGPTADFSDRNQKILGSPTSTLAIGDKLAFSFDFYDITGTGNPYRQFSTLGTGTAPTGTGQLIGMGLSNNLLAGDQGGNYYMGRILGGASNGGGTSAYFKLNDAGAPLRSAGWHNLKVEVSTSNATSQDYRFYVDGTLSETVLGVGTSLRQYDVMKMGAGLSSTSDAYYDNFLIEFIPFVPPVTNDADFNEDGTIDAGDYPSWRKFNPTATGATEAMGDADGDGDVDAADEAKWEMTFGNSSPTGSGGSGAVPEPSSIVMLLLALAGLASRRRG